jgi:bifunctional UDP-N-acetylglucosamine pyrophosphorylase/glucosamine-1-phosphate N-acetyltransferase
MTIVTPVILAAGQGTRMKSNLPKVLHPLMGRPLIDYSINSVREATGETPVIVVGYQADEVRQVVGEAACFVLQEEQLGTAHAVLQAESLLSGKTDLVLVTTADMPLLTVETMTSLIETQKKNTGPVSLLTIRGGGFYDFGRIVRGKDGRITAIVEQAQATPDQLKIEEYNVSVYVFRSGWLWDALRRIHKSPKGEYYLTDIVVVAISEGLRVETALLNDPAEALGINTRVHLAAAQAAMRDRINNRWMLAGVTLFDPATTWIDDTVELESDVTLWPGCYLHGKTRIGTGSEIGPNSIITDTTLGKDCRVFASVLEGALVEDGVDMGPFCHLRKGAHLADGVHMGNFGEVKSSYLGPGTKMGHFSYIGDATIGENVNIGAGTITCNYDGEHKNKTVIGSDVFIGSDTMLVAPLKIGDKAKTGAGSVVTHDVEPGTVVVGVPARRHQKS